MKCQKSHFSLHITIDYQRFVSRDCPVGKITASELMARDCWQVQNSFISPLRQERYRKELFYSSLVGGLFYVCMVFFFCLFV